MKDIVIQEFAKRKNKRNEFKMFTFIKKNYLTKTKKFYLKF